MLSPLPGCRHVCVPEEKQQGLCQSGAPGGLKQRASPGERVRGCGVEVGGDRRRSEEEQEGWREGLWEYSPSAPPAPPDHHRSVWLAALSFLAARFSLM